eukprot:CAMPEP_0203912030 /NCGR_PEP_ID=MMETSP0359-20131031/53138_1 /ASSEMBLY_ACC=CAM_ASM_000338 /TAXON_ID=268821 /ORGANISM="Scrippsiella Hangoei, Strain SHTV-5" /LENGTH=52 /DNA_ID=CAMNT_0050837879 /DNA_START=149 /DNA_END=307 /DNA_ORIENTATION=-
MIRCPILRKEPRHLLAIDGECETRRGRHAVLSDEGSSTWSANFGSEGIVFDT